MKSLLFVVLASLFLASCAMKAPSETPTPPPVTEAPPAAITITPFLARGTEPFWLFEQTATGGVYSTPDPSGGIISLLYTTTQTMVGPQIVVAANPVSTGTTLTVTLTPGTCTDGMSDLLYAYTAQLVIGAQTYSGCAN